MVKVWWILSWSFKSRSVPSACLLNRMWKDSIKVLDSGYAEYCSSLIWKVPKERGLYVRAQWCLDNFMTYFHLFAAPISNGFLVARGLHYSVFFPLLLLNSFEGIDLHHAHFGCCHETDVLDGHMAGALCTLCISSYSDSFKATKLINSRLPECLLWHI